MSRLERKLQAGKGAALAIEDGYKMLIHQLPDANVTTLLTGIILWFFLRNYIQLKDLLKHLWWYFNFIV